MTNGPYDGREEKRAKRERNKAVDIELFGAGLLGESMAPEHSSTLGQRFMVPPFTILNAREGVWQDRKRAWLALGIQSELGRGEDLAFRDASEWRQETPRLPQQKEEQPASAVSEETIPQKRVMPLVEVTAPPPATILRPPPTPSRLAMPSIAVTATKERPAIPASIVTATKLTVQNTTPVEPKPVRLPLDDPFLKYHEATLAAAKGNQLPFAAAWDFDDKSPVGIDVEMFRNFFLVCCKRFSTGQHIAFEMSERSTLAVQPLRKILDTARLITFNGNAYDLPMIFLALGGKDLDSLKIASDRVVYGNLKPWDVERELGVRVPKLDHVDLLESNPSVRQGLKMLAARLHARFLVDLPFDPATWLTHEQMNIVTLYCCNDLDDTQLLFDGLKESYELRRALSNEYRYDLRSKSDAQIGEAIVKMRVEATGKRIARSDPLSQDGTFRYQVPGWVSFEEPRLCQLIQELGRTDFLVSGGDVKTPQLLDDLRITIGATSYAMGIGGLHSTEAHRAVLADDKHYLVDIDVSSQYPKIIMKLGLYPPALGPEFLDVYSALIDERLAAKAAGQKVKADGLKISVNGVYGKLGSPFSPLFAPHVMVAVTLTGQLSLLMLIERCEAAGIECVSGNTDGVVLRVPRDMEATLKDIVTCWEEETGFNVEHTRYKAIYSSSVNTYIAIKEDGKAKRKGAIANPWLDNDLRGQMQKNPQMCICSDAVLKLITDGTPIEETILACKDPKQFVTVTRVNGGAQWRGTPLGRVVRYYWATNGDPITYIKGNKKVSKTDGAKPMMELLSELPSDIDYVRYINEAKDLAEDLAAVTPDGLLK